MTIDQLNELLGRASTYWLLFMIVVLLLLIYAKVSSSKRK